MARYEELKYRLLLLSEEFPHLLRLKTAGSVSYEGKTYDILRLKVREGSDAGKVKVCLAFGTHGNEDLSIESMHEFLRSLLDPFYTHPLIDLPSPEERLGLLRAVSLTIYFFNPVGLEHTERSDGKRHDLNRWFGKEHPPQEVQLVMEDMRHRRFDACIDLHGDIEGEGFMIYEHTRLGRSLARDVITVLRDRGVHIVRDGDNAGDLVQGGVVDAPPPLHTFDDYLFSEKRVKVALTLEYPGKEGASADIKSLVLALYTALTLLSTGIAATKVR